MSRFDSFMRQQNKDIILDFSNNYFNLHPRTHALSFFHKIRYYSFGETGPTSPSIVTMYMGMHSDNCCLVDQGCARASESQWSTSMYVCWWSNAQFLQIYIHTQGIAEAGIDGGGLTREFITDVLKKGFGELASCCIVLYSASHRPGNWVFSR